MIQVSFLAILSKKLNNSWINKKGYPSFFHPLFHLSEFIVPILSISMKSKNISKVRVAILWWVMELLLMWQEIKRKCCWKNYCHIKNNISLPFSLVKPVIYSTNTPFSHSDWFVTEVHSFNWAEFDQSHHSYPWFKRFRKKAIYLWNHLFRRRSGSHELI